jgi:hypothetical protein
VPEVTGPRGAMLAARAASGDPSVLRFECHRCTRVRRLRTVSIGVTFAVLVALILLLEKLGALR